ncbi:alpha mannosidase-like protein, partial [Tulasnella sp. 403]
MKTDGVDDRHGTLPIASHHPVESICDVPATPCVSASIASTFNPEAPGPITPRKHSEHPGETILSLEFPFDVFSRHPLHRTTKFNGDTSPTQLAPRNPTADASNAGRTFPRYHLRKKQDRPDFGDGSAGSLFWLFAILQLARLFAALPNELSGGDHGSGKWNWGSDGLSRGTGSASGSNGQSSSDTNFNGLSHSDPTQTSEPPNSWLRQPTPRTIPIDAIAYYQGGLVEANGLFQRPAQLRLCYNQDNRPFPGPPPPLQHSTPSLATTPTGDSTLVSSSIQDVGLLRHTAPLLDNYTLFPSPRTQGGPLPQPQAALPNADPDRQEGAEPVSSTDGHHQFSSPYMTTWLQRLAFAVGLSAATKRVSSSGWTEERKLLAREEVRVLWNHGFQHYMDHAFPMDELQPISCQGRGPDWSNPGNYAANDVNGNFSITLVDVLDTFVTLNDPDGFETAVRNVIENVSFNVNTKPQVFETTIRALGGLLSAHLFASDEAMTDQFVVGQQRKRRREQKSFKLGWYRGELLDLAHDLGKRLLPAFETPTGLPYARVNLQSGVPADETTQTCTAGAGSLLLEFTTLSRLTGDDRFEKLAKKAYQAVWDRRTPLSLVGNGIDVITG